MYTSVYRSLWQSHIRFKLTRFGWCIRGLHGPPKQNEYNAVAVYPPIPKYKANQHSNIPNRRVKDEENRLAIKEHIKQLGTVEEKVFAINRPKFYGWYSYIVHSNHVPHDSLDFIQFATWTSKIEGLPEIYSNAELTEAATKALKTIAPKIEQAILDETVHHKHGFLVRDDGDPRRDKKCKGSFPELQRETYLEKDKSDSLIKKIHEVIISHLDHSGHLANSTEDVRPRNEAFWFRGGVQPDKSMKKKRLGLKKMIDGKIKKGAPDEGSYTDEWVNQVYDRAIQIKSKPLLQLRSDTPLPPFVDRDSLISTTSQVPECTYDPRTFGYKAECQHGRNVPGYWPDDQNQFGLLAYANRFNKSNHAAVCTEGVYTEEVLRNQTIAQAIITSFGWLLPQAVHLGFSPLTDLTYPLSTQTVVTDGRMWTFSAYQLNTCDLSTNNPEEHTHSNLCWVDSDKCLYERVRSGSVEGFNPSALLPLIKMYLLQPQDRSHNMTPYLEGSGRLSDFQDRYQRQFLHEEVLKLNCNRPKHQSFRKPEIYMWEKIYQIDNKTMHHLGTRRARWWQMTQVSHMGKEHWHPEFKSFDEPKHRYLPRAYRERWQTKPGLGRRYSRHLPKLKIPLQKDPGPHPTWILKDSPMDYTNLDRPVSKLKIGPREGKIRVPK